MPGVGRLYLRVSALGFTASLAGLLFLLTAWWVVPEWVDEQRSRLSAWIGGHAGPSGAGAGEMPSRRRDGPPAGRPESVGSSSKPAMRPATSPAATTLAGAWLGQGPSVGIDTSDGAPRGASLWGGIGAIEESVKQIESDLARYRQGAAGRGDVLEANAHSLDLVERLRAWERLREPLFALLEAARSETDPPLRSTGGDDIRRLGAVLALRIRSLTSRLKEDSRELLQGVEPRTVFHFLLFDGESMDDSEALRLLACLKRSEAMDVIDRLARIEPSRARRLLFGLAGASWDDGGEESLERGADSEPRLQARDGTETTRRSPRLRG